MGQVVTKKESTTRVLETELTHTSAESNDKQVESNDKQVESNDKQVESNDKQGESNDKEVELNHKQGESNDKQFKLNDNQVESNDKPVGSNNKPVESIENQAESNAKIDTINEDSENIEVKLNDSTIDKIGNETKLNAPIDDIIEIQDTSTYTLKESIGNQSKSNVITIESTVAKAELKDNTLENIVNRTKTTDNVVKSKNQKVKSNVEDDRFIIQLACSDNRKYLLIKLTKQVFATLNIKVSNNQIEQSFDSGEYNKDKKKRKNRKVFVCLFEDQANRSFIKDYLSNLVQFRISVICLVVFHHKILGKSVKTIERVPNSVSYVQYVYTTENNSLEIDNKYFENNNSSSETTITDFLDRDVIIFCNQTNLTPAVKDFFEQKLSLHPYIDNTYDRSRHGHTIVICCEHSRLKSDVQEVVRKLQPSIAKNYCIIILRHREDPNLDTEICNNTELYETDDYLKQFGSVIDCVYNHNSQIYDCDVNVTAGELIRYFLKHNPIYGTVMGTGATKSKGEIKDQQEQKQGSDSVSGSSFETSSKPWLNVGSESLDLEFCEKLVRDIEQLKPLSPPDARMNIAIIGHKGAGKSSFINTLRSHFTGYVSKVAETGISTDSVTSELAKYDISKDTLNHIWLCDTRGISNDFGLNSSDFDHLLNGNIKNGYSFETKKQIQADSDKFLANPKIDDKIHCVCFVFDGNTLGNMKRPAFLTVRSFLDKIGKNKLRFIILLTKMDRVCTDVRDDVSNIYKSTRVEGLVKKVASNLQIETSDIIPVVNYTQSSEIVYAMDAVALFALRQMIRRCNDFLSNQDRETYLQSKVTMAEEVSKFPFMQKKDRYLFRTIDLEILIHGSV